MTMVVKMSLVWVSVFIINQRGECLNFRPTDWLCLFFQDQIDHLKKLKIPAATINSQIPAAERQRVIDDLRCVKTSIKLLYVAPEQAMTNTFKASIYLLCFLLF